MPAIYEYRIRRIRRSRAAESNLLCVPTPAGLAGFLRQRLHHYDREQFMVVHLDADNAVVGYEITAIGSLAGVEVHPREVFRSAILAGAIGITVAHNHPSNSRNPSPEDDLLTARLAEAGELLGIPLLDHLILTETDYYSYLEHDSGRKLRFVLPLVRLTDQGL